MSTSASPARYWTIGLALLVIVAVADYATGYELALFIFYFPAVIILSWSGRRGSAIGIAVACGCVCFAMDLAMQHPYSSEFYRYWNALIRFVTFLTVAVAVLQIRWRFDKEEQLDHERELATQALKESEAKYRELVQNANSIILRIDVAGNVTFFNEFAQRFFGYAENEILGRNVVGTLMPETDTDDRNLAAVIKDIGQHPDQYVNTENENILRNGERVWIAWTNKPICDSEGRLKEILCVGNDITWRVRAEGLIIEQRVKMINASRLSAVGTMAGGIAHEIGGPLTIISLAVERLGTLLENDRLDRGEIDKVCESITNNVNRVDRIIRGLRTLARDGAQDRFCKIPVKSLVADTIELCQARFAAHEITLTVSDIPAALEIECRPVQLSQVLLNLLNNGHDAVVTLPEKWVRLEVKDEGETVLLTVTDSGRGLPIEIRDKVFVPFFTTKELGKGIGLGLSIARQVAQGHHGDLSLDANGSHTRFVVRLPKQQPKTDIEHDAGEQETLF
jgi:PAS domain S-box-containing protein